MLEATQIRELALEAPSAPGRPAHLSAASGIVRRGDFLYVIGDDELDLAVFRYQSDRPGRLVRLFEGELSAEAGERKAHKPDLEAITGLPPFEGHPHGALLALGSGSREPRQRGVVWALDADGSLRGRARQIDLTNLYSFLRRHVAELNVEGVAVSGERLALFQRGNSAEGDNAIVFLSLDEVMDSLSGDLVIHASQLLELRSYELGDVGGVRLAFTDGDALPDGRVVFTAAAEDTDNPYDDGLTGGSAIGVIDSAGDVTTIESLADDSLKVEGVDSVLSDELIHLLLGCDADDPAVPSPLLSATLPARAG